MIKRFFATLVLFLGFLIIFPTITLAYTNYGDGTYGGGVYGVGDPAPVASSSEITYSASPTNCGDTASVGVPDLFEIRTNKNSATLYFAPPIKPYSNFYIAYSQKSDSWQYGVQFNQSSSGVLNYTIKSLQPNTKYYFRIRSGNGCATGNWGNIMTANTTSGQNKTYYKNLVTRIVQTIKNLTSKISTKINPSSTPSPTQKPVQSQSKFCVLWWCF